MNTKLIGSGTRSYALVDSYGQIPWLHWAVFRNFLLQHITGQSLIIGDENFQDPFFQQFLSKACLKVTVVSDKKFSQFSNVFPCKNPKIALASATNATSEVVLFGDNALSEIFFETVSEIYFLRVDMNLLSTSLSFPKINAQQFREVSWMEDREELWTLDCKYFQNKPRREVHVIQFQHWMKRLSPVV